MAEEKKGSTISFEIKNPYLIVFLLFGITIAVLELSVILNRPIAFGDGAYHSYIAKYIGQNEIFPKVLPGLNSYYTYSPLLHLLLSIFYIAPFGEILAKVFIPILVFLTGLGIFVTTAKFFTKKMALLSAVFVTTIPIFATYSVLIYTDILMIFFFALSTMFTLIAEKDGSRKYWVLAVIFAGMAFLSKGIGLISFGFIAFVLLYKFFKKEYTIKEFFNLGILLAVISILVIGGWLIRNIIFFEAIDCNLPLPKGNCVKEIINPDISKKFEGYVVPSGSNVNVMNFGLKNFMVFMYGNMWLVPLAAIIGIVLAFSRRENVDYFNLLLLFLAIFPALVISFIGWQIGSEQRTEDIARYMILSAFAVPLIAAVFIDKFLDFLRKYWKYLSVILIIIIIYFSWVNFKEKLTTMSSVTQFSTAFFDACNFIKSNTEKDSTFLTLWAAPTVYNCERTAMWESDYLPDIVLSQNITTVLNATKASGTDYIFIQKFALSQKAYQASIPMTFVQFLNSNPEHFENIYENGPKLDDCIKQGGCDGTIVYKIKY